MRNILLTILILFIATGPVLAERDVKVEGSEGGDATIYLYADEGDDNADKFSIVAQDAGGLAVKNNGTTIFTYSANGNQAVVGTTNAQFGVTGAEKSYAQILLDADDGDDNADSYFLRSTTDNLLKFINHTTTIFTFNSAGKITLADSETIENASDVVTIASDDNHATLTLYGFDDKDAILILDADTGDDNTDTWFIKSEATGNDLSFVNHVTEVVNVTSGGDLQIDGDMMITGNGLNSAGDLLITPTGTEVHLDGGLDVGGTGAVGDNNLSVAGTAALIGVATFTAESIHNLGIDADYITTDAGAGVDTKTAGTLGIAAATADKVEIADTGIETEIQGTLDCQEAVTMTADLTATNATALFNTAGIDNLAGVNGYMSIGSVTQLWFTSGNVTNILDQDITN